MTKIVLHTLALAAFLLIPAMASADTFVFQGCEMQKAENGNYYFSKVPGCITGQDGGDAADANAFNETARPDPEAEAPGETPSKS